MARAVRTLPANLPRVTAAAEAIPAEPKDVAELAQSVRNIADAVQRGDDDTRQTLLELSDVVRMVLVRDIRSAYVAGAWELVLADPTAGSFTITLPKAADNEGARIDIKHDSDSDNIVTVAVHPDDTVDGKATATLDIRKCLSFVADSRKPGWVII